MYQCGKFSALFFNGLSKIRHCSKELFPLAIWNRHALIAQARPGVANRSSPYRYRLPVGHLVTRVLVLLLLTVWIYCEVRQPWQDRGDFCERALLILAALFLLSPAQFPWYYVMIIPFLTLRPQWSLLLLTVLLPLYYLSYAF